MADRHHTLTPVSAGFIDASARNISRHDQRQAALSACTLTPEQISDLPDAQFLEMLELATDYRAFCKRHLGYAEQACSRLEARATLSP